MTHAAGKVVAHNGAKALPRNWRKRAGGHRTPPAYVQTEPALVALRSLQALAPVEWKAIDAGWRVQWLRHRLREYVNVHGYASSGVCALLEKAAAAYADSDYLRALAYSNGEYGLLDKSMRCTAIGKSLELTAYEIAAREGAAKAALDALDQNHLQNLAEGLAERQGPAKGKPKRKANGKRKANPDRAGGVLTLDDEDWTDEELGIVPAPAHHATSGPFPYQRNDFPFATPPGGQLAGAPIAARSSPKSGSPNIGPDLPTPSHFPPKPFEDTDP